MATQSSFQRLPTASPPEGPLVDTAFIKPEWVESGAVNEKGFFFYNNEERNVQVGFWQCTAFSETITFPYDEMGIVRKGRLELVDDDGRSEVFAPGDVFFIPRGSTTTWHVIEDFEQIYMIYAPRETQYYEF